jgi:uncharacterized membrane protein
LKGIPHHVDGREKFPQFQSLVLFPLLLDGVTKMNLMSAAQVFIILRITTAFVAYVAFLLICTRLEGMPIKIAGISQD